MDTVATTTTATNNFDEPLKTPGYLSMSSAASSTSHLPPSPQSLGKGSSRSKRLDRTAERQGLSRSNSSDSSASTTSQSSYTLQHIQRLGLSPPAPLLEVGPKRRPSAGPPPSLSPSSLSPPGVHDDIQVKQPRQFKPYLQAQAIHYKSQISVLDKEARTISYHGLVNFALLLLTGTIVRLVLENYLIYGILVELPRGLFSDADWEYIFAAVSVVYACLYAGFAIEQWAARQAVASRKKYRQQRQLAAAADQGGVLHPYDGIDRWALAMHAINLCTVLLVPSLLTYFAIFNPVLGTMTMTMTCLAFLKLWSWCATNLDLRRAYRFGDVEFTCDPVVCVSAQKASRAAADPALSSAMTSAANSDQDESSSTSPRTRDHMLSHPPPPHKHSARSPAKYTVSYPNNIRISNMLYFLVAPTLCYQPSYPRVLGPVRKRFVVKRLAELAIIFTALYILTYQYAFPILTGSIRAMDENNLLWIWERILKLSVVSTTFWILGFYALFHSFLNLVAELLRFGDRTFYLDWWNSVDLAAYWREWNLPIHYFCKRHIMLPLTSPPFNLSVRVGIVMTFLISAIMHELLIGIPTHSVKGYSFVGMLMQIPLAHLTQWLVRWRGAESGLGNMIFWVSFCIVGQPFLVVKYYYDWVKANSSTIDAFPDASRDLVDFVRFKS